MLTEFPLNLTGTIFGSPMPYGLYDPEGIFLQELKRATVSVVERFTEEGHQENRTGTGGPFCTLVRSSVPPPHA